MWAFGVLLYSALTGRRPYENCTQLQVIHKVRPWSNLHTLLEAGKLRLSRLKVTGLSKGWHVDGCACWRAPRS